MNKIKYSLVALLMGATYSFAGGDVAPIVEPEVIVPEVLEVVVEGPYAGLGYSCLDLQAKVPYNDARAMTAVTLKGGYNFNKYIAVEGSYTMSVGDLTFKDDRGIKVDGAGDLSNFGLYVKPQYQTGQFGVYALLGYGQFTADIDGVSRSEASIQYGAGVNVNIVESVSVYADYRRLYDDAGFDGSDKNIDYMANSYTVGLNYHF